MRKGWFGILLCISLIFSFSGIKGKFTENMRAEFVALEQNSNGIVFYSQGSPENESGQVSTKSLTSRLANSNIDICEYFTLTTLSTSPRSISFPKPLKSIHSLQIHSTLHPPLFAKNSEIQCFHYCFVEASCRYYIYTLRRIII